MGQTRFVYYDSWLKEIEGLFLTCGYGGDTGFVYYHDWWLKEIKGLFLTCGYGREKVIDTRPFSGSICAVGEHCPDTTNSGTAPGHQEMAIGDHSMTSAIS